MANVVGLELAVSQVPDLELKRGLIGGLEQQAALYKNENTVGI